jgi:hypothetical protein
MRPPRAHTPSVANPKLNILVFNVQNNEIISFQPEEDLEGSLKRGGYTRKKIEVV